MKCADYLREMAGVAVVAEVNWPRGKMLVAMGGGFGQISWEQA
jgi:hypothetical protein